MKKRIVSLIVATVMVLGTLALAGCGCGKRVVVRGRAVDLPNLTRNMYLNLKSLILISETDMLTP